MLIDSLKTLISQFSEYEKPGMIKICIPMIQKEGRSAII